MNQNNIPKQSIAPLAERMRSRDFDEFCGQEQIVGKDKLLRKLIENNQLSSIILWGPPGTGKTTLANIVARKMDSMFVILSGVSSGKADLRQVVKQAKIDLQDNKQTILFIDEIHRWSKLQQDALLPHVEKGELILIGATTENPYFEIIGALLSRSQVFILKYLEIEEIIKIIKQALQDKDRGLGKLKINIKPDTLELLANLSGGDARVALNGLDLAVRSKPKTNVINISSEDIKEALQRTHLVFDKKGEEFYNLISALHKSMRGSDANASLYWLARMLEGGCDPLYIARRVLRFACEDIGMANSEALVQASTAFDACHKIGMPECSVHLAQAVVYCAKSKKSNILYRAYEEAAMDARNTSQLGVPLHLRNAPTSFMKNINYGKGYQYNPDVDGEVKQDYLPKELKNKNYLVSGRTRSTNYMNAQKNNNKNNSFKK